MLLAEGERSGLVHVAGPEPIDRVQYARAIAAAFGLTVSGIEAKSTAELTQGAPRPLSGGPSMPRLDAWRPGLMRPLGACLDDFRQKLADLELQGWIKPIPLS